MIKTIHTEKAPKAVGPYSQAIKAFELIFCAGQIGIDPKTGELVKGLENQVKQVMKNMEAVLEESGSDFNNVLKTTIFIKNMDDYAKVNEIYGVYFKDRKPARSTVEVSRLPKDALVEIEAIAMQKFDDMGGCGCGGSCGC